MEHEREEESGEMFSPNESGEYMLHNDAVSFTVQGLGGCPHCSRVYCNRTTMSHG